MANDLSELSTPYLPPTLSPLEAVADELRQWRKHGHWWEPESEDRLDGLTAPSDTRTDWERSFGELAEVIFGGLKVEAITSALTEDAIPFEPVEGPLPLLRKIVESREADGTVEKLRGLSVVLALRPESAQGTRPETDAAWEETLVSCFFIVFLLLLIMRAVKWY